MPVPRTTVMQRNSIIERCIEDCHGICVETIAHCLNVGGKHAEQKHVALMQDCADICTISEDYMLRGSELMNRMCSDACIACAESCESFPDDKTMATCAEKCRACADSCRQMSSASEESGSRMTRFS